MFTQARLKLTGWYLLIIMIISIAFSVVIYRAGSFEIERFAAAQRNRFERYEAPQPQPFIDKELIEETKHRISTTLLIINLGILGIAGLLGFYLSGKTLQPIQEMMDEQYRFISDASHELKTPITALKSTLEVAIRDTDMKIVEAKDTLSTSLTEVNRLQKLAEGLLELTHKNIAENLTPINLADTINLAVKTIKPIAQKKNISIKVKMPKIITMMDELSMVRAMTAILDNSVKYSPNKSEIKITGKINNRTIYVCIVDYGKGIAKKDIARVFDRLYRTDPARSEKGYGLGLSIAKQIIEDHSGSIEIDSELNKGTIVKIELPYSAKLQK